MLSKILSALGVAPKTLPQATETLGEAKATLDSVAALFTAAGLNLEQILAVGPDALKAHIESIDNSEELAVALQENEKLAKDLGDSHQVAKDQEAVIAEHTKIFAAVGVTTGVVTPAAFAEAFQSHVSKQTTLALAKTGHPPQHVPAAAIDDVTPPKNEGDAAAKAALTNYEALIVADNQARTSASNQARTEFYAKNHALIDRGLQLRRRS
jgi:hypothetical protein